MKIVLTKDEAKEYIGFAIGEALFPGRRMKVTSVDWVKYNEEVAIELEEDREHTKAADKALGKLGGRTPPAPSLRPGIETPGSGWTREQGTARDEPL